MRAPRTEPRPEFTTQSLSGLMTMWTSFPFCLTTLYIDGAYQASVSAGLLLARGRSPNLLPAGSVVALLVDVPGVGLVAASDDAVVADHVVFLGVRRDDRQAVGLTLVGHADPPFRARSTGGRRAARRRPRRRCRRCRRRAARIAGGSGSRGPRSPGRRPRSRRASSGRGSSGSGRSAL